MAKKRTLAQVVGTLPKFRVEPQLLLHPQIPQPMHGLAPRVVLGLAWWNRERRKVYASNQFHCQACGVSKTNAKYHQWLEAHEVYDIDYERGRMTYLHAVPLCHFCHAFIHDGRLQWLLETGRLNYAKYASIIQHGDAVLAAAGLERPTRIERERYIHGLAINGLLAKWSDWRMVIDGIEFLPLFNSVEEYNEANTKIWEE